LKSEFCSYLLATSIEPLIQLGNFSSMPRENRKRGKKHKKQPEEQEQVYHSQVPQEQEQEQEPLERPSWIVPNTSEEFNPEAPFGYVENDVKAYFRTVDVQIRDWQDNQEEAPEEGDVDPNERAYTTSGDTFSI